MRMNRLKQLWREGEAAVGGFLSIPHVLATCQPRKVVAAMHAGNSRFTQRSINQGFQMIMPEVGLLPRLSDRLV